MASTDSCGFAVTMKQWMNGRVHFAPKGALEFPIKGNIIVTLSDGSQRQIDFGDDPTVLISQRTPYDEDAIVRRANVLKDRIIVPTDAPGSFFDKIIAANKKLINTIINPNVKLVASKICIKTMMRPDTFSIQMDSHLGIRIFKSSIYDSCEKIGEVVFYGAR